MSGGSVSFWADIVNHVYEIGFGARFVALTDAQQTYIQRYVDTLKGD
jgi:hypothetical protein